jgi:hypothetical protein
MSIRRTYASLTHFTSLWYNDYVLCIYHSFWRAHCKLLEVWWRYHWSIPCSASWWCRYSRFTSGSLTTTGRWPETLRGWIPCQDRRYTLISVKVWVMIRIMHISHIAMTYSDSSQFSCHINIANYFLLIALHRIALDWIYRRSGGHSCLPKTRLIPEREWGSNWW